MKDLSDLKKVFMLAVLLQGMISYGQGLPIVGFGDPANYTINTFSVPGSSGLDLHWHGGIRFGDKTGSDVMRIENGNVGIGTSTPATKLSVLGVISKLTETGIDGTFDNLIKYGHKSDLESGTSYANRWHGIDATITAGTAEQNKLKFRLYSGGTGNLTPVDVMTLLGNGRVGIGTVNPDSKLTVAGNIHAQEVKVTARAGEVPDYVFANDYKLKSLEEVERYIKQNSHLPEIPSAKEIEKNGLMLAEMNLSLLKKMEEMTLYMIEQNKRIKDLEKQIEEIKRK